MHVPLIYIFIRINEFSHKVSQKFIKWNYLNSLKGGKNERILVCRLISASKYVSGENIFLRANNRVRKQL